MPLKHVWFFWIPKAAGTSIYKSLKPYGLKHLKSRQLYENFDNQGWVTFAHVDPNYLLEHKFVSKEYCQKSFKFAFVRNPWDRLISLYHYFKLHKQKQFADFVKELYHHIEPLGPFNYKGLSMANPQAHWLTDSSGKLLVDYVGKYESLETDFSHICQKLGVKAVLTHTNRSTRTPRDLLSNISAKLKFPIYAGARDPFQYRQYYNQQTKKLVAKIYAKDIGTFGYTF